MNYQGQAGQDKFVAEVLKFKKDGYFVEIGSENYISHNNSYVLEKELGWRGIMIDMTQDCLAGWKKHRQNSVHIIDDATKIDYEQLFATNNVPENVDYLQIDLDVENRSTLDVLEKFDSTIFNKHKFATITFEHDIYRGNYYNTRNKSRQIFKNRGYELVFPDVSCQFLGRLCVFEDWWVHPDLVDMEFINKNRKSSSILGKSIKYG